MTMNKRDAGSLPLFQTPQGANAPFPDFPFDAKSVPDFQFENYLHAQGFNSIAGTDEAGRGPLAGPVVAAAVILPLGAQIEGLNDSKKLSIAKRNILFDVVMDVALSVAVTSISAETIDRTDIRKASLEAMRRSIMRLGIAPDFVLADGRDIPPNFPSHMQAKALVKGDGRSMTIAAAAIVAKVTRDRMMAQIGLENEGYGLEKHMGYGSAQHRAKIGNKGGITRIHRFSFRPLRKDVFS
ncbi:ribonuclease HII [Ahrensia kielensis]|uniref:ribonuclease HII n=1 Tax=Ahrensia kielensis TaxID=76980 RepID=UPI00037C375D|nr:ribonuclease HII [Ahrensia kielensis]